MSSPKITRMLGLPRCGRRLLRRLLGLRDLGAVDGIDGGRG
jgi:hypothetical protein